ncbi:MAG: hypothetical protein ACOY33_11485 [Pseudomonadota bacterium]
MSQRVLSPLIALTVFSLFAASADAGNLYRYKNDKGQVVLESTIPPERAALGYQIISPSGTVIQDVPPSARGAKAERDREDDARNARLDVQLRKLYSAPADAVRLRDRQIDAVKLKMEFSRGQIVQLSNKRKTELEQAARLERSGQPVSAQTKANLDNINRRIAVHEEEIKGYERDQQKIRDDFTLVIKRLNVIYPDKALPPEPAPAAAAPAAAPTAPAAPAAPAKQ